MASTRRRPRNPPDDLISLARVLLIEEWPTLTLTDSMIDEALAWATKPVGRYLALLRPSHQHVDPQRFLVIDALLPCEIRAHPVHPSVIEALRDKAATHFSLGQEAETAGRWEEAETAYRDAITTNHPEHAPPAAKMLHAGLADRRRERDLISLCEELASSPLRGLAAWGANERAQLAERANKHDDAVGWYRQAIDQCDPPSGNYPLSTGHAAATCKRSLPSRAVRPKPRLESTTPQT